MLNTIAPARRRPDARIPDWKRLARHLCWGTVVLEKIIDLLCWPPLSPARVADAGAGLD